MVFKTVMVVVEAVVVVVSSSKEAKKSADTKTKDQRAKRLSTGAENKMSQAPALWFDAMLKVVMVSVTEVIVVSGPPGAGDATCVTMTFSTGCFQSTMVTTRLATAKRAPQGLVRSAAMVLNIVPIWKIVL